MFRYRQRNQNNNDDSIPEKTNKNTKMISINQTTNHPTQNLGYHSIRDTKQSEKKEISTKNQTITAGNKYVISTKKNEPSNEFVKKSGYKSYTISHPSQSELTKKQYEINNNINKYKSVENSHTSSSYKRRSNLNKEDLKENNIKEDIKNNKTRDNKEIIPNRNRENDERKNKYNNINKDYINNKKENEERKKNYNNINKDNVNKKEENNNATKYIRKFNRDEENDKNEVKIEQTDSTNSNINNSTKHITGFTKGRLVNEDSTDKLEKIDKEKLSNKKFDVKSKQEKEENQISQKEKNEPEINGAKKEFKNKRFERDNKIEDNLPQKDINLINENEDFQIENEDLIKENNYAQGARKRPHNYYDNRGIEEIQEVIENNENNENNENDNNPINEKYNNNITLNDSTENKNHKKEEANLNQNENIYDEKELKEEKDEEIEDNNANNKKINKPIFIKEEINEEINQEREEEKKENNNYLINNEYINMDNTFNEVELFNAKKILKGDLAEIYFDIIKKNTNFKDDIFFVNLNHFEKKVGDCDEKLISHNYKDFKKGELFKEIKTSKELIQKYTEKAKRIREENEL